jgi:predicted dehydrogenase
VTSSGRVRVALIGCGRIARVHRSYLEKIADVELVGVFDVDQGSRESFVAGSTLPAFASLAELIESARPDVAHVLTPPATHAAVAKQLLAAGVNALVEKPLAMSAAEADEVVAAAREAGVWVSVDHNRFFDPVVQRAAAAVESGRLGDVLGVDVFQGAEIGEAEKMLAPSDDWRVNLPGGILHNLASHPLYLMRRFAGPVSHLEVLATQLVAGKLAEARVVAQGERCLATVTISARTRPFMNRLSIYGSAGSIEVNLNNMTFIERRTRQLPKLIGKVWPNVDEARQLLASTTKNTIEYLRGKQGFYPGIGVHLAKLYASVAAGGPPAVSAEEGRDVVAWYDQILAAAGIDDAAAASVAS